MMLPTRCTARYPWRARGWALRQRPEDEMTCPLDTSRYTPRVRSPSQYVRFASHTVRVQQLVESPRVRLLHDFITEAEASEMLRLAGPLFMRSPVRSVATDRRTSSTATLRVKGNWAVDLVRQRISTFSGYDLNFLEPLQVVRYQPGEKYEAHHDYFDLCDFEQRPRRHLTFLVYLNDLPGEDGGATSFPRLNVHVQPKARSALVFNDVLDNGMDDERTEHAGNPPARGVKYAINCWIRAGRIV